MDEKETALSKVTIAAPIDNEKEEEGHCLC
jgi:hypothetical protein